MDPRFEIRSYLRMLREAWSVGQMQRLGLVYRGPADFVLQHGRWWKPIPLPPEVPAGLPRTCYGSSLSTALLCGLRYVQGWALPFANAFPVPHAWNADAAGHAIDTTWRAPGLAYLGVEFSPERADDATWNGDADVLDDYLRHWPLLRQRWTGELAEPDSSWRPSPALLALRARLAGDEDEAFRQMMLADAEARP